jgi:hypothetical protein
MNSLKLALSELEQNIKHVDAINTTVSQASVGWHIEHTLLTLNGITSALIHANSETYKPTFNFNRLLVFTINKIPRGRGKAPERVQPKNTISVETLTQHIINTRENIKILETLDKRQYFAHPFFGHLRLSKAITFLNIHTKHHLSIIKDIVK